MSKLIPLTRGFSAIVDDADFEWLSQWKWYYHNGYAVRKGNGKSIHMHRTVMSTPDTSVCDHINGIGVDNQRGNLQNCTAKDNHRNHRQFVGTSKYKGVYVEKGRKGWRADIRVDYKLRFLGRHPSELEAARAYDQAARIYFGEFALLNFPDEVAP